MILVLTLIVVPLVLSKTKENTAKPDSLEKIVIKQSGFMKDDEIVIRYHSSDQTIVEVIDKGEKIPEQDFDEYVSMLWSYLELRDIELIKPKIEDLRRAVRLKSGLDRREFQRFRRVEERLERLRERLESRRDSRSDRLLERTLELNRRLAEVRERHLTAAGRLEQLDGFIDRLLEEKIIESREDLEIEFKKGTCRINGKKVPHETTKRIKEIYKEIHGKEINDDGFLIKK